MTCRYLWCQRTRALIGWRCFTIFVVRCDVNNTYKIVYGPVILICVLCIYNTVLIICYCTINLTTPTMCDRQILPVKCYQNASNLIEACTQDKEEQPSQDDYGINVNKWSRLKYLQLLYFTRSVFSFVRYLWNIYGDAIVLFYWYYKFPTT